MKLQTIIATCAALVAAPLAAAQHAGDIWIDVDEQDRIVIGEVRGREALALLKAWNTGHPGGLTTVHANSAGAALSRIDQLVQEAGVPSQPQLIADSVDLVVSIARQNGGRRVEELLRVEGYEPGQGYRLSAHLHRPGKHGRAVGFRSRR